MQDHAAPDAALALSVPDAARCLGLSRARLYELIATGEGPPTVKIGRRRLVRVAALERWLADLES